MEAHARRVGDPKEADVLDLLRCAKHPLSLRELARGLNLYGRGRHDFKQALKHLLQQRQVAEVHGGRLIPAERTRAQEERRWTAPKRVALTLGLVKM